MPPPRQMEIDVIGTFSMSRAAFCALKQSGDAVIINISATLHYGVATSTETLPANLQSPSHQYKIPLCSSCPSLFKDHQTTSTFLWLLCTGATWYQVHASAAKAAIDSLTRTLGLEWGSFGIRTAGVAPGPIGDNALPPQLAAPMNKLLFLPHSHRHSFRSLCSRRHCSLPILRTPLFPGDT